MRAVALTPPAATPPTPAADGWGMVSENSFYPFLRTAMWSAAGLVGSLVWSIELIACL